MAVDLGFAGIIEKFEEHWGKGATRWLLMIIGLAVVAACVGAVWEWLVSPLLTFFESPDWQQNIAFLALSTLGIGAGVGVGLYLAAALGEWRYSRQLAVLAKRAKGIVAVGDATLDRAEKLSGRAGETLSAAQDVLVKSSSMMREMLKYRRNDLLSDRTLPSDFRSAALSELDMMLAALDELEEARKGPRNEE